MISIYKKYIEFCDNYFNVALNGASYKEFLVRIKRNALDGAVVSLRNKMGKKL